MNDIVSKEKLEKYFAITGEAIDQIKEKGFDPDRSKEAADVFDMAQRYFSDAGHFRDKGDRVLAFAALNYAHGWLDCGATLGLFKVSDSRLFTVDDNPS
ncbi:DUF357 domain-containing protein [Candidatus Woesearchaeota archaeon]|nr:DUF357 domain-containing protein [Candidatus Woesearchaeota archaeon]